MMNKNHSDGLAAPVATDVMISEQALAQRIESWQKSGFKHISRKNISPHVILETP